MNDLPPFEIDYPVTTGCKETRTPFKKIIEWEIPDPKGKSVEFYREIRDLVENKVKALIEESV